MKHDFYSKIKKKLLFSMHSEIFQSQKYRLVPLTDQDRLPTFNWLQKASLKQRDIFFSLSLRGTQVEKNCSFCSVFFRNLLCLVK